jgi:hypothetical protein
VTAVAGLSALLLWGGLRTHPPPGSEERATPPATDGADMLCVARDHLRTGETLYDLLLRHGLPPRTVVEVAAALAKVYPPRQLWPDDEFELRLTSDQRLAGLSVARSLIERYDVELVGDAYRAKRIDVAVDTAVAVIHGRLDDNLWTSFLEAGAPPELIVSFTEIFAWSLDFFRDVQPGDAFGAVYSALSVEGETVATGPIRAAYYVRGGDTLWAYGFPEEGTLKYYDTVGQSLQKALLRAPLKFSRVSSSFSRNRLHPVSGVYRPHNGIDYAADRGTPVFAAGDGQVRYVGWKSGLGNCIEIRHPNGYRTVYGHLLKFARGLKTGQAVSQRDVIGFVGMTGLASGYHLHYEVRLGSKPVNPATLKLPARGPVPAGHRQEFEKRRNALYRELVPGYGPLLAEAR